MELAEKVLLVLSDEGSSDSLKLSSKLNEDHQKIVGAIKSLESLGNVVKTETKAVKKFELTKEGAEVAERGSHEAVVYGKVPKEVCILKVWIESLNDLANAKFDGNRELTSPHL